ncbi:MAG: lasso peptide biosynthesis PqqD family chaperone [Clostridium sp.]|nr:lasso peptide biosynthesis PqqD family chaperone [Clostridium sp.]
MINIKPITNNTIIYRKNNIEWTDLNDDFVMMDIEKGKYYAINSSGGAIWEKIKNPISVSSLINYLITEFQIDKNTCYEDTLKFLNQLNDSKLICTENK